MGWCCYERKVMSEMPQGQKKAPGDRRNGSRGAGGPLWGGVLGWYIGFRLIMRRTASTCNVSGKDAGGFLQPGLAVSGLIARPQLFFLSAQGA